MDPLIEVIVTVLSVVPVSRVMTMFPSTSVTASLNVAVTLISSPILYLPSAVVDVTDEMVGTAVSIIISEPVARLVPMEKLLIALPAASDSAPADRAMALTVRSELISPV